MLADLHMHSVYSDGLSLPAETARAGRAELIALTDHDTVAGVSEFLAAAKLYNKKAIAGVELSTYFGEEIHILGYNIDISNKPLLDTLNIINGHRRERNIKIIEKLKSHGMDLSYEEIGSGALATVNRLHIGRAMVKKGYVADFKEALRKYIGDGKPCSAPNFNIDTKDAINIIKQAGGVPVLAHAGRLRAHDGELLNLINQLVSFGIEGIEVYYPKHSQILVRILKQICENNNLIATSGSDRHGPASGESDFCCELDAKTLRKLGVV